MGQSLIRALREGTQFKLQGAIASAGSPRLGQEAAAMGLANRATPKETVLEETLAYANELATQCSPASMATIKRQVYAALEQALPVALAEADEAMLRSFSQPDFIEGVSSFVERRAPEFEALTGQR